MQLQDCKAVHMLSLLDPRCQAPSRYNHVHVHVSIMMDAHCHSSPRTPQFSTALIYGLCHSWTTHKNNCNRMDG